ncbi:4-hydroxybenzoyl-CoA thioesterase [Asanoa ishikariensis]|uniref:Acyl-CoA thioester hydrolase n=1 Tax=Asanoa ishikariensis TaxID=137265 RepID=A0A1H3UW71_9ACTN|nr:thioesterase family protein [Asanoa ishikariensis]GIF65200.1 4-hydroxybenzoyl-CoA thioesterase [Asanoa ishikariensis]SDZ66597.1 acyl-CoA thioester hydrolase [Asanoa ishikariensis]
MTTTTIEYGHAERVRIHYDDLDSMGIVHNSRYALLLERALTAYWEERGFGIVDGRPTAPDVFHAVAEFAIQYKAPIRGTGDVLIHFWLDAFGTSSGVYGFRVTSVDGAIVHAEGRRSIVRLDPATMRPTPWTPAARAVAAPLLKPSARSEEAA